MNLRKSEQAYQRAKQVMPGGVNSPARDFSSVAMDPIFMDHGKGAVLTDIDGNDYIDYVLSFGPLILGHADDGVVSTVQQAAAAGTSFGTPNEWETKLAELVIERVPSIEVIRMVNSGTEATMSAIRLARGYTGRDKIIKFTGCYHGHVNALLTKAGSGVATLGLPDSPGIPQDVIAQTMTAPYNDLAAVQELFAKYGDDIAGVIVEPVAGNMGVVPPAEGFLQGLRELTKDHGSLLIFDEVMTGFRVGYHCAQGYYDVTPDVTCLGKVIGGGMPVGAYGASEEIMRHVAPDGDIYQAGTLSGNPLAMAAGYVTLSRLTPEVYDHLTAKAVRLADGLQKAAQSAGVPYTVNRAGSMLGQFFANDSVTDYDSAQTADQTAFSQYYTAMLQEGIYLAPSQFEAMFLSTAHRDEDIQMTIKAAETAFQQLD